eukprot:2497464-Amphidinium_carterae.1
MHLPNIDSSSGLLVVICVQRNAFLRGEKRQGVQSILSQTKPCFLGIRQSSLELVRALSSDSHLLLASGARYAKLAVSSFRLALAITTPNETGCKLNRGVLRVLKLL